MKSIYFSFAIIALCIMPVQGMDQQQPTKNNGRYLLHQAAQKGLLKLVKSFVINYEATDLNQKNDEGLTPLQVAEKHHQTAIIQFLSNWQTVSTEQKNELRQQQTMPSQEEQPEENISHHSYCAICKKPCVPQIQLPCCNAYLHQNCFIENRKTIKQLKKWPCPNPDCSAVTDFSNQS